MADKEELKEDNLEQIAGGAGDRENQYDVMNRKRKELIEKVRKIQEEAQQLPDTDLNQVDGGKILTDWKDIVRHGEVGGNGGSNG